MANIVHVRNEVFLLDHCSVGVNKDYDVHSYATTETVASGRAEKYQIVYQDSRLIDGIENLLHDNLVVKAILPGSLSVPLYVP